MNLDEYIDRIASGQILPKPTHRQRRYIPGGIGYIPGTDSFGRTDTKIMCQFYIKGKLAYSRVCTKQSRKQWQEKVLQRTKNLEGEKYFAFMTIDF